MLIIGPDRTPQYTTIQKTMYSFEPDSINKAVAKNMGAPCCDHPMVSRMIDTMLNKSPLPEYLESLSLKKITEAKVTEIMEVL